MTTRIRLPDGRLAEPDFGPNPHYHLVWTIGEHVTVAPAVYLDRTAAFRAIYAEGERAEPNTEWHDDGSTVVELRFRERPGLHRVRISVGSCRHAKCLKGTAGKAKGGA